MLELKTNFITSFIRKIRLYHMDMLTAIIKFAWRDKKSLFSRLRNCARNKILEMNAIDYVSNKIFTENILFALLLNINWCNSRKKQKSCEIECPVITYSSSCNS